MSHFDRALGLARSLAIYHAIPRRQRRMRRLYADFVTRGDLVPDVGAHAGNRTRAVLAGLTQAVPALSFEYLPRALDHVEASIARVRALGPYRFNWSLGESYRLASSRWMNDRELLADLRTPVAQRRPGDVYARIAE